MLRRPQIRSILAAASVASAWLAAAVLRELGESHGRGPRTVGVLTAREDEVLGLVALGMSNAGIARTLVISEKTAGHHVSRILTKLGVRNRTEAAQYAVHSESSLRPVAPAPPTPHGGLRSGDSTSPVPEKSVSARSSGTGARSIADR